MTDWHLTVNDAVTGTFRSHVNIADDSTWSTSLTGDGTSTETIVTTDADEPWTPDEIDETFEGNSRLIVRWWGNQPMYAHKIDENEIDYDTGKVQIQASDLIRETDWRMLDGVGSQKYSSLAFANRNASGAIRAIFERMMQWSPDWKYPIDLPPDGSGDITKIWYFWQKLRISDMVKQVEDQTGSESFLQPYSPGGWDVRFRLLVGAPIVTGQTTFQLTADDSPLSGVKRRKSWRRCVTGVLGVGNGTGEVQETRWAGTPEAPIRDTKESFPRLVGDALQQAVDKYYEANSGPVTQYSVGSLKISDAVSPLLAAPGARLRLKPATGDPVSLRVVKVSGGNGREIKTEVQDAPA